MPDFSIREFKPTIFFLCKFIGLYLVGNLLYGWYITSFEPRPDPITHWVTGQTAFILTACGWPSAAEDEALKPRTDLIFDDRIVLRVYEGCNGLNTMIVFVAFVLAFGPFNKSMIWFIPLGLLIIHLMNLLRIFMLFFVSKYFPDFMYFTHKYLFTAFLYLVIFSLWFWWVRRVSVREVAAHSNGNR